MALEVVKTVKPSGGDYTSLAAWEAGEQRDLVALDQIAVAECYAFDDVTEVGVGGWVTDATRYVHIRAAPGAKAAVPYTSAQYRLLTTNARPLVLQADNVKITDIRLKLTATFTGWHAIRGMPATPTAAVYHLSGLVLEGVVAAGSTVAGLHAAGNGAYYYVRNCVAYGFSGGVGSGGVGFNTGSDWGARLFVENSLAYRCYSGFAGWTSGGWVRNCIAQDPDGVGFSGYSGGSVLANCYNNVSSDSTALGANSKTLATVAFVDAVNGDFHLASGDTVAKDSGADLSTVGAVPFAVDLDGVTRPQGAAWDIGAFEYVPVATNANPVVAITSPSASSLAVPAGTKLLLEFTATDAESGNLAATANVTSSNTADGTGGDLGNGSPLTINTTGWADGTRTITVIATDAGLAEGSDSFVLTIGTGGASFDKARFLIQTLGGV